MPGGKNLRLLRKLLEKTVSRCTRSCYGTFLMFMLATIISKLSNITFKTIKTPMLQPCLISQLTQRFHTSSHLRAKIILAWVRREERWKIARQQPENINECSRHKLGTRLYSMERVNSTRSNRAQMLDRWPSVAMNIKISLAKPAL